VLLPHGLNELAMNCRSESTTDHTDHTDQDPTDLGRDSLVRTTRDQ